MTTRNVGQPFVRRDGRTKVTGEARYAYETSVPGAAYGVLVTSAIAKGRIVEIFETHGATVTTFRAGRLQPVRGIEGCE